MTTPESPQEPNDTPSLLDQIIKTSHEEKISFASLEQDTPSNITTPESSGINIIAAKKNRDPITA